MKTFLEGSQKSRAAGLAEFFNDRGNQLENSKFAERFAVEDNIYFDCAAMLDHYRSIERAAISILIDKRYDGIEIAKLYKSAIRIFMRNLLDEEKQEMKEHLLSLDQEIPPALK